MDDKLHILVTGEEGKGREFLLSKRKLKVGVGVLSGLLLTLSIVTYNSRHLLHSNATLAFQVNALNKQVSSLSSDLGKSSASNDTLSLKLSDLKQKNSSQEEEFLLEKRALLDSAVTELEERSNMIERIMCNIGVKIKAPKATNDNSGGPYIAPRKEIGRELLSRSDNFLSTITSVPLGRPVPGKVSSRFGHRTDPVNGKRGFHSGVDMRGNTGDKIIATADGVVSKAFWNGGYGRYIEINHGNGYTTRFAHMRSMKVKRGDKVTRGQTIGTVGNSGRSTGSHLHYEICLYNKAINPANFMQKEKLNQAATVKQLTAQKSKKIKPLLVAKKQ